MELEEILQELESLGTERTRKAYLSRGAREPLFGVATGAMKPLARRVGRDQGLADELWNTGNYDAMYFAGMIADVDAMTSTDFERWVDTADYGMLSDFVVAVTLAESGLAQTLATCWIEHGDENRRSAGWACWEWLLGWLPDDSFHPDTVRRLLALAVSTIHSQSARVKRAMNGFIVAAGVSYLPVHDEALRAAAEIGTVEVRIDGATKTMASAEEQIRNAEQKGRLGFKRRAVRC